MISCLTHDNTMSVLNIIEETMRSFEEEFRDVLIFDFTESIQRITVFDISGYPHYENVISNWYAFFLNPVNEHCLEYLFLDALSSLIKERGAAIDLDTITIEREVATANGGRIDLLISNRNKDGKISRAIIIENKIYADDYNDLDDYWNSFPLEANNKLGILLTLTKCIPKHPGFINITHLEWVNKIQFLLPQFWQDANDRHLLLLKDFTENIKRITGIEKNMEKELQFLMEHGEKVSQLIDLEKKGMQAVTQKLVAGLQAAGWQYNSTNSTTVSFSRPDSSGYSYINFQNLFRKKELKLEFWLKGESVIYWSKVEDISELKERFSGLITFDDKKQGTSWVRLGHKLIQDLNQDKLLNIEEIVKKEYAEYLEPFFEAVDQLIMSIKSRG